MTSIAAAPRGARLERLLALRLPLRREVLLFAILFAAAFALRFWDLGARALHHDESIHAQWSWGLLQGNYRHDPVFHGPLYYHAQALVFFLFGASDYTARVSAAIFGSALVALPLLFRRRLGLVGTVAAVALIAFSPTIVYFSRFFREDIYMAFFTMVMAGAMWRYLDGGRERWLVLFGLAFAASMATKEATYLTVAVFLVFLNLYLASVLAGQAAAFRGISGRWQRPALVAAIAPFAWALAAAWPLVGRYRARWGWDSLPRVGDLLVLLGTLTVPFLTALLRGPLEGAGLIEEKRLVCRCFWDEATKAVNCRPTHPGRDIVAMAGLFAVTGSGAALVGLQWKPRTWALAVAGGGILYLTLMTSFWTNLEGLCSGPWGSIDYWLSQQAERRGNQPWFYYFMLMPAYEFLPLAIALGGAWWSLVRGDALSRFLWLWMAGTWLALSMSGEKMPWLNTHIALPAALLAAWTVARAVRAWEPRPDWRRAAPALGSVALTALGALASMVFVGGPLATLIRVGLAILAVGVIGYAAVPLGRRALPLVLVVAVAGGLSLFSVRTMIMATFERGDVPKDLLIYTQTSPDIARIADEIDALAAATGRGLDLPIAIDTADSFAWPWAWYLRDYKAVSYVDFGNWSPTGDYAVLIVNQSNAGRVADSLESAGVGRYGSPVPFPHRWWFDESAYRAAITTGPWTGVHAFGPFEIPSFVPESETWKTIRRGLAGGWLDTLFTYWRDHDPHRPSGSVDALVYFPANFDRHSGLLTARAVESPRPGTDSEGRPMFGSIGSLPGQFFSPVDVESDAAGNLYVIDRSSKKLQKFDSAGNFLASADVRLNPLDPGEQSEPWGLGIGPAGQVIVADTFGWRVRILDRDLRPTAVTFGKPDSSKGPFDLFGPRDAAVDAVGNLWITDTGNDRVMVYTMDGAFVREAGGPGRGPGQFDEPVGLAIAPDGAIFIADMYNRRVQILDRSGAPLSSFEVPGWGGQEVRDKPYLRPLRDGRVAVSLPTANEVRVYDRQGKLTATIAPTGVPLNRPYGIVEAADGRLWIVEGGAGRLRLFTIE